MIYIGIDPGSVSGAVGAVDSNGDYLDSFMIQHQDKHILAVGVITAVCTLTNYPLHMVSPQKWKKHFHLSSDKNEALDVARMLWPTAPLKRKKDINIAESLLIAEYWRDMINGKTREKSDTR